MITRSKLRENVLRSRLLQLMVLGLFCLCSTPSYSQFNTQWDILYGGNNFDELISVVEVDDGLVFGGTASSSITGDPPPTAGDSDYWIYKTDFDGNIIWSYTYGGLASDKLQDLIITQDGGFIMAGTSSSNNGAFKSEDSRGGDDIWVVKVDANGLFIWDATFGGDQIEFVSTIIQSQDGSYFFGGWTESLISGEVSSSSRGGQFDYWLCHIDINGNFLYDRRFGGNNNDQIFDLTQIPGGDIIMTGLSNSNMSGEKSQNSFGSQDIWTIRMDMAGTIIWDRTYGGLQDEQGWTVDYLPSGELLMSGFSRSGATGNKTSENIGGADYWLLKTSLDGDLIYDRTFGGTGEDETRVLRINEKGLYYIGGRSTSGIGGDKSESNRGALDYWLIIVDDDGDVKYDKTLGGNNIDLFRGLEILDNGGIICAGYTASNTSGDITDTSNGTNDNWVVFLDCTIDQFLDLGVDRTVCEYTQQTLDANTGQAEICSYLWDDNSSVIIRDEIVTASTFFAVTVTDNFGCQAIDTVNYNILPAPEFNLGTAQIGLCLGQDTLLTSGLNPADHTFVWNDGDMNPSRVLDLPGTYILEVTDINSCVFSDTVIINNLPQPDADLGPDLEFCEGESRVITVADLGPSYEWSVPNTGASLTVSETGKYFVTVTNDDGCFMIDSVEVQVNENPEVDLGPNQIICEEDQVSLDASESGCVGCTYLWDDMSSNPIRMETPLFNTSYAVTVTSEDMCTQTDQVNVVVFANSTVRVNDFTCDIAEVRNDTVFSVNQNNCDSTTIYNIVLLPSDTLRFNLGVCDPDLVGRDTIFDTNTFGCDSLNAFNYFLLPSSVENLSSGTCDPNEVGIDTLYFINEFGCDSTIIQEFTALPSTENTFNFVSCDPEETGRDTLFFINEFGCDSTIINVTERILSDTLRFNEPVCFASEVRSDTIAFTNDVGCDSLEITNFFLVASDTINNTSFTCDATEIRNDTTFIQNTFGCDSLVIDIVNLAPSSEDEILIFTCDEMQVLRDTLLETNIFGCDSIIIRNFEFVSGDTITLNKFVCEAPAYQDTAFLFNDRGCDSLVISVFEEAFSDNVQLDDFTCDQDLVGIQIFNLINQFGCDSTVTIDYELVDMQLTILNENTCDPAQFMPDTMVFSTSFCDSMVITNYTVQQENNTILNVVSCDINDVGEFTSVFSNQQGCDSTVTQVITFSEEDFTYLNRYECGRIDTLIEETNFVNQFGCDSTVVTTILPGLDTTFINQVVCEITAEFRDEEMFISVEGCDSIVVTSGIYTEELNTVFEIYTCEEDNLGSTTLTFTSETGCDSLVTFNTILGEVELIGNVQNVPCGEVGTGQVSLRGNAGQLPYLFNINGDAFSAQNVFNELNIGFYEFGVQDADGCESFIELEITELTGITIELPTVVRLEFGEPLNLNPNVIGAYTDFFWTGVDSLLCETCFDQSFTPLTSSTVAFNVRSEDGCLEKHQVIIIVQKNYDVFIPNAFSPNGDNINDTFTIFGGPNVLEITNLSIYSRWGEQVFQSADFAPNDTTIGWNGTFNGDPMNPGVFVYKAQILYFDGTIQEFEGDLSLIR